MNTESPITALKGIGEKTAALFHRVGVDTVGELLSYYPRTYDVYEPPVTFANIEEDKIQAVTGFVRKAPVSARAGRTTVTTLTLEEFGEHLHLSWFHMPFLRNSLTPGSTWIFRGRVQKKKGRLLMEQPEIFTPEAYEEKLHAMQPVYSLTSGLSNKTVEKAVRQALEEITLEKEYLPEDIRTGQQLAEFNFAARAIHFPADKEELLLARRRLVFDEFFLFILALRQLREKRDQQENRCVISEGERVRQLFSTLPYELTGAQKRVLGEIEKDLKSSSVMNRLVQGDVGSGKTIVAAAALLAAADSGFQGAFMAPTEVLARQHAASLQELFERLEPKTEIVLLTGSMTAKEKREAYEKIASGEADLVIGTHALIQDKVTFKKLGLVVTDEQHRFGVRQRETLAGKGDTPHVLVMSATPIPRTLAIIIYGDLDISVIDELPANRLPIKSCVVDESYRPTAYRFLEKEVFAGRQVYIICPMVEENPELEIENVVDYACVVDESYRPTAYRFLEKEVFAGRQVYIICPMVEENPELEIENVVDYAKKLREALDPSISVAYLHGKMKPSEKNEIMEAFASGNIQVLVSTTVVEVGVNVPNATVMMVENAERFGLAQLHQLRGRVGRGGHQSYCIFISGTKSKDTKKRLEILKKSNDGFYIASEDLKLRGPGDLFGVRQSGLLEFKIGDIFTDARILQEASEEAAKLEEKDPELQREEHQALRKRLEYYKNGWNKEGGKILL